MMKQRKILLTYISMSTNGMSAGSAPYWVSVETKMTEAFYIKLQEHLKKQNNLPNAVIAGIIPCDEYRDKPEG